MKHETLTLLCWIATAPIGSACTPAAGENDGDGGTDGVPGCVDRDGDGFGQGDDCQGDDCDDLDPELSDDCGSEANCTGGVHVTGCACELDQMLPCYTGPAGTAEVGECRYGMRDCVGGLYQACEGQRLPAGEACDARDEDCDGVVDDGVLSACGDCNSCIEESVGVGGDRGFDPDSPGARGVVLLPDGSITLGSSGGVSNRVIWIANSFEGTVSKVDTTTNEELGRYRTGSGNHSDPSRSTVNRHGDVVSVNRSDSSATFIMASDCPDGNGDGMVSTSGGAHDVRAWGDDECVIWNLPIAGGGARGAAIEVRAELDGTIKEYAWVGSLDSGMVYEIDVAAGELTGREQTTSPARPYGAAMGPDHTLWVTTSGPFMARMDTDTLVVTVYESPEGRSFYGITLDSNGFVWLSGREGAQRFDPATEQYELVADGGGCGGGIAADGEGNVWTGHGYICDPNGVARIDPVTMEAHVIATGGDTHGVAVDFDGNVWGINVEGGNAHKIRPGDESFEIAWTAGPGGGWSSNYTYSDMTGYQLVNATQKLATYSVVLTGCGEAVETTRWANLSWIADTPAGTSVAFAARTADDPGALAGAAQVPIASQPPDESPVHIGDALVAAGVTPGRHLEMDVTLRSTARDAAPIVRQLAVQHSCDVPFE